jgi:hypothetical protein
MKRTVSLRPLYINLIVSPSTTSVTLVLKAVAGGFAAA